jgi:uncharacterized membrane protein YfcA
MLGTAASSYLSNCTVLSMACISVLRNWRVGGIKLDPVRSTPIAIGAAIGGYAGKALFDMFSTRMGEAKAGCIQSGMLLAITFATFIYTLKVDKIKKLHIRSVTVCAMSGLLLGVSSSFLGIGGGPINLMAFSFLFSMDEKISAVNSLYVIVLSQAVSVLSGIFTGHVPEIAPMLLISMVICGFIGGILGSRINMKISGFVVRRLFLCLMIVIMLICTYNLIIISAVSNIRV